MLMNHLGDLKELFSPMTKNLLNSIKIDFDQQKGSLNKSGQLEDYQHAETITTASKLTFYLVAVADGGGNIAPEKIAKLAVDSICAECRKSTGTALDNILYQSLLAANSAAFQQSQGKDYMGITVVAVTDDKVYIGQAGPLTRAYLIRDDQDPDEKPKPLLAGSTKCLGDSISQPDFRVEKVSEAIRKGDRLVLCSDGLFSPPGEGGRGVNQELADKIEKGIHVAGQYDDIHGLARHLSSLAKGLDVADDITVVVIGFGRKAQQSSKTIPVVLAGVTILALAIVAIVSLRPQPTPLPPDLGLAVLVSGEAVSVDPQSGSQSNVPQLSGIEPRTTLIMPQGNSAAFKLKKRTDTQSTNTVVIPGVDIYLSQQTKITLTTLDLAPFVDNQPAKPELLKRTEITLVDGQILIRSDGGRNYAILLPSTDEKKNNRFALTSGGAGTLGVTLEGGTTAEAYCLRGVCEYVPAKGNVVTLSSPSKTVIDVTTSSLLSANEPVTEVDWQLWNTLCSGSQSGSCDLSK